MIDASLITFNNLSKAKTLNRHLKTKMTGRFVLIFTSFGLWTIDALFFFLPFRLNLHLDVDLDLSVDVWMDVPVGKCG